MRLKSSNLTLPKNREYLSQKDKNKLFESYNNKCAICGTLVPPGIRGLQADHKKPLSRGGGNELENWQPLCHNCNVGKKSACKGCELECSTCSWAYPDKVGIKTIVSINQEVLDQVKIYASKKESTIDKVMEEAIKYFITKKDQ